MKKAIAVLLIAFVAIGLVFAAGAKESAPSTVKLVVGATPEPHAAFLSLIVSDLAAQGIALEVREFTDYVTPNAALNAGELDANFFQHIPYLEDQISSQGYKLANAGGIHIEPFALYSRKVTSLKDLKNGATVAIPNDPTNGGRALLLLQSAGLITLKAGAGLSATVLDIASNPKGLKITELEAATLPRVLGDVDLAAINGNYAIPAGLTATKDGLFVEGADSPYVNVVAVRAGDESKPAIQALVKALKSKVVQDYVAVTYKDGEVVLVD
ncbi:MetQ/NlpA family ABC transporter substrate-binding protein [Parasphaerochaeta coccoides]|uniref:Lipoprotein n=1 Tax=Parasphaerochaeta coccoides (strain ATCC BAA-1237 / DSM 17374 / SPN1) TaxID=760011 RepID=F4GKQ2_PARC1|nr:MetQ/NlpA family ABC transporter substrate-binding protein [Parasphaerochaeta coccoides]AEC01461.1 NLPA lipoprotein [Parasphaerochaeta coccoides DSM 17374]